MSESQLREKIAELRAAIKAREAAFNRSRRPIDKARLRRDINTLRSQFATAQRQLARLRRGDGAKQRPQPAKQPAKRGLKLFKDPYRGVTPTPGNARQLVKFYTAALLLAPGPVLKAYLLGRLIAAKRAARGAATWRKDSQSTLVRAKRVRQRAAEARGQRNYALAMRLDQDAERLEREAAADDFGPVAPVLAPSDLPDGAFDPTAPAENVAAKVLPGDADAAPEGVEFDVPWYKRPIVWLGVAAVAGVGVALARRGKRGARGAPGPAPSGPRVFRGFKKTA